MTRLLVAVSVLMAAIPAQGPHLVTVACCSFTDSVSGTNVTTVPAGTTVQWNLVGALPHTVTNGTSSLLPSAGTLFDASLNTLTPTFSTTFNVPGVVPYFCRPHELLGMNGTVVVTTAASATSIGTGCGGSSGMPLTLSPNGLPTLGNTGFALDLAGGPPGASAYAFGAFGAANPPIPLTPGCSIYLDLASTLALIQAGVSPIGPLPLSPNGTLNLPLPVPGDNGLMGARIDVQFAVADAGAPGGLVSSNSVALVFGL